MQLEATRPAKRRVISLTPLIDVVFILLLFFMLSSSFTQWNALEIKPPASSSQAVEHPPIIARLTQDGSLEIDSERIDLTSDSHSRLSALITQYKDRPLIVLPQPQVTAQQVVTAFDRLRAAGATAVTLANAQP